MKKLILFWALFLVFSLYSLSWADEIIYYCPKCQSENVEIVCTYEPPEPEVVRKSLDEVEDGFGTICVHPVVHLYPWEARCLDCGYVRQFSRSYHPGRFSLKSGGEIFLR